MDKMLRRIVTCGVKQVSDRVLEFVGSTEVMDRCEESIKASGWQLKNYRKNPVFLWAHDYKQPPVGKAVKVWKEEGELRFHIEFAPADVYGFADTILQLYLNGYLRAVSVGFMPLQWEDGPGKDTPFGEPAKEPRRIYTKQDLLELSGCPVPANPEALSSAVTGGLITVKQLKDFEHEAAAELGAEAAQFKVWFDSENAEDANLPNLGMVGIPGRVWMLRPVADVIISSVTTDSANDLETGSTTINPFETGDVIEDDTITLPPDGPESVIVVESPEPEMRPEETDDYIHLPAKGEEGKHKDHKIRVMDVSKKEGIKGKYCIDCKKVISYMFEKAKGWTMEKAKKWMKDHGKSINEDVLTIENLEAMVDELTKHGYLVTGGGIDNLVDDGEQGLWPEANGVSQGEIRDELDYCHTLLSKYGLSQDAVDAAWDLIREVLRVTGNDIPDDIRSALTVTKEEPAGEGDWTEDDRAVIAALVSDAVREALGK